MLNTQLRKLCEAILNESVGNEDFGHLLAECGVKLDDQEWNVANELLKKSDEINHAVACTDIKTIH